VLLETHGKMLEDFNLYRSQWMDDYAWPGMLVDAHFIFLFRTQGLDMTVVIHF
jgi:hypothetical protein